MRFGIVSYNRYGNFTNYGSALQSWALCTAINRTGLGEAVLVNYCPDVLADKEPLDPMKNMWDKDEKARRQCELTLPAIRVNYRKFCDFFDTQFSSTSRRYTSANFNDCLKNERLDGFVCGSDTIFCVDEFGFDDGYYASYPCMQGRSVAYAASFGDITLRAEDRPELSRRLQNFRRIALREEGMIAHVSGEVNVPVDRVIDPTLLLECADYAPITADPQEEAPYLLLYARRYNPAMETYAEKLARENGWKIVEISLRAENAQKHRMFYEAGVEEFLSLVSGAVFVVTNSYHGMIFSVQHRRPFVIFSREQCSGKITELLALLGLSDRLYVTGEETSSPIDYEAVHSRISAERARSLGILRQELACLASSSRKLNFSVGPVMSSEGVCEVGAQQVPYFRTAEFSAVMKENEKLACCFAGASKDSRAVFLTASGTGAMEAAVMNAFTPADRVLVVNGGSFGQRFCELCAIHSIPYTAIPLPAGTPLTADHLSPFEGAGYTGFLINLHETSTGVLYDQRLVADFCRRNSLFLVADAISSFLADPICMEACGIDMLLAGSQKALACPPGVSLIVLSSRAVERVRQTDSGSLYFNLKDALLNGERGQTPFTPAVGILLQIHQRLKEIEASGGVLAEIARIKMLAEDFRRKIKGLPLELFSPSMSNACTALHPLNTSANEIFLTLKDEYGIWVCPNGGAMKDTVFRVGHLGALTPEDNAALVKALDDLHKRGLL